MENKFYKNSSILFCVGSIRKRDNYWRSDCLLVFLWFLELDKELIEEEICTRLDGCPIVKGVCVDCLNVKN